MKSSKGKRKKWKSLFIYCQSQIENNKKCTEQCDHCKEYYKPLEDKNK